MSEVWCLLPPAIIVHRNGFCSMQTVGLASVFVVQGSLNSTAVHSSLSQDLVLHHSFVVVVIMFIYCTIRKMGLTACPVSHCWLVFSLLIFVCCDKTMVDKTASRLESRSDWHKRVIAKKNKQKTTSAAAVWHISVPWWLQTCWIYYGDVTRA